MIDRLFTAALTFVLLAGGTAAIGSALFAGAAAAEPVALHAQAKRLPSVLVVIDRQQLARSEAPRDQRLQ